ncbi:MAG: OmpH family outer membrane protein [Gammaproteobacteria bacterium]|nr:OmpH family outer membrane protein [Gammaproteobacteria bacterium]
MLRKVHVMIFSLFLVMGLSLGNTASAELKLGAVNAAVILEKAPQAEQARKLLEKEFAPRDSELVKLQKSIKANDDKLQRDGAVMSESERVKLEREVISQKRELKRKQDEFREDFNIRRNEEFGKLQKRIYEAIVAQAKKDKYDVILGDGVIYASDTADITQQVLKRLKAESAKK